MKRLILVIINILVFFTIIGILIFGFWYVGIFKKEPQISEKILKLKNQIEFINNYPFGEANKFFSSLSTQIYQIPSLTSEEIGRSSLF